MKKNYFFILFLLLNVIFFTNTFFYETISGDDEEDLIITILEGKYIYELNQIYYEIYYENNQTILWNFSDKNLNIDIKAELIKDNIILKGIHKGQYVEKTFRVNRGLWLQNSEMGFLYNLDKLDDGLFFYSIAPEDLSLNRLKASFDKSEIIIIDNKEIKAMKIRASLTGILSPFWSSYYWFDENYTFVKYKANSFLFVPETTIIIRDYF